MPTPVSAARQCLTEEAASALDEAVAVALRRNHAQTTSLHLISALLSLPSSFLRDACTRARTSSCSPRLQFRALELNLGVSLDRLPTSKARENDGVGPPVSNSLMAAIKRSQANQRRHSDNFSFSSPLTGPALRVELKYFVLSVLDDPIVSRVFGEAGFRSCEVKLGILQPKGSLGGFPRGPPLFLGPAGFLGQGSGEEKRVFDVMLGKGKGKNPLLVGVYACEVLKRFVNGISDSNCVESSPGLSVSCLEFSQSWIETRGKEVLPRELVGLRVISLEDVVYDGEAVALKIEEVRGAMKQCLGVGVLVNLGDLKGLVGEGVCGSGVSCLISELKGLVEGYGDKLWLIGAADRYEVYLELVKGFPEIEKDLDLHLLNITSSNCFSDPSTYKSSLMRSFVPFGGFFSTSDDLRSPLGMNQSVSCCHLCTAKYEQEVAAVVNKQSTITVADKYCENLPSWLQMADISPSNRIGVMQTVDDGATTTATILGLQMKWKDICRQLHYAPHSSKIDNSPAKSQIKIFEGIGSTSEQIGMSCSKESSSPDEIQCQKANVVETDSQTFRAKHSLSMLIAPEIANSFHQSKLSEVPKCQQAGRLSTLTPCATPIGSAISPSVFSVTNISDCRTPFASRACEPQPFKKCDPTEHPSPFSAKYSTASDADGHCISHQTGHSYSSTSHCSEGQFDLNLDKRIRKTLAEKVSWQVEAICTISKAVSSLRSRSGRYNGPNYADNIWLTFLGPDRFGKKQIASTIAEIVFGSRSRLVYVDVNFQGKVHPSNSILEWNELDDHDVNFRKTPVDYIAAELRKKPGSVMFLDNVEMADPLVQSSLSQAVRTGKFSDSHGREIGFRSMIFVTTAQNVPLKKNLLPEGNSNKFSEEEVLAAKRWQLRISFELNAVNAEGSKEMNIRVPRKLTYAETSPKKRKWYRTMGERTMDDSKQCQKTLKAFLDLNLPAEMDEEETSYGDSSESSENAEAWLEDFLDQVDEKVVFKPFDFDVLADKLMKLIQLNFQKVFGSDALLEITREVMVQLLAASWSSDSERALENWVENVLTEGFTEAQQKSQGAGKILVRIACCEGLLVEEQADGICLPSKINT